MFTLPRRDRNAHKGDFGKVFVLAGSILHFFCIFFFVL